MPNEPTIIGIDGGASKVSAHVIQRTNNGFALSNVKVVREYKNYPNFQDDFKPIDLQIQLSDIKSGNIKLQKSEIDQAQAYYQAIIDVIIEIANTHKNNKLLIGIGMPGIKSDDGRGIIAMANGPRMPHFAREIEQKLTKQNVGLIAPIFRLGSDADYCGLGEEYALNGAFRGVNNAYYLGGGTGVADALKLKGRLIPFDECKAWLAKTWEFKTDNGSPMEMYCSASGVQSLYGYYSEISKNVLMESNIYINEILLKAFEGEQTALQTWEIVVQKLAELIFERILTIYSGWQNSFEFIDVNHIKLERNHKYIGNLLDRIVIGQRLGDTLKVPSANKIILEPLKKKLYDLISSSTHLGANAKDHYISHRKFNDNILTLSALRAAPALGAGIDAWNNYAKR